MSFPMISKTNDPIRSASLAAAIALALFLPSWLSAESAPSTRAIIERVLVGSGYPERSRAYCEYGLKDVREKNPEMPGEDFEFLGELMQRHDYSEKLIGRWSAFFSADEWSQIAAYLDEVGAKEIAGMRAIEVDVIELKKGKEFISARMQALYESLSSKEQKADAAFRNSEMGQRFWRLFGQLDQESKEAVFGYFPEALRQTESRRNGIIRAAQARGASPYGTDYGNRYNQDNPLFDVSKVDIYPIPKIQESPELSPELAALRLSARVIVEFVITKTGTTENAVVVNSTDERLNKSCLDAIAKWTFNPAKKGGKDVNCRVQLPMDFKP